MLIFLLLAAPLGVILLARAVPLLDKLGVVPLIFVIGFLAAVFIDIPALFGPGAGDLQQTIAEVSIALALPLIIFAANIRRALADAGGALRAVFAGFAAVVVTSLLGVLLFGAAIPEPPTVAALATGAYTGSNINMGAINTAIGGSEDIFLTLITYDIVFSVLYMIVVLLLGRRLAGLVLRPYEGRAEAAGGAEGLDHLADESARGYRRILSAPPLETALAFIAAALCVGAALGVAMLFPPSLSSVVTILAITTFGLLGSLIGRLNRAESSFHLGMYFILIFCFATATQLDTRVFTEMNQALAGYFLFVIFGAMALHAALCRLMNVDRDTFLVASCASVMSVPFIPVITGALKNRALLVPGIAIAVLGYGVGNYLGVMVAGMAGALAP